MTNNKSNAQCRVIIWTLRHWLQCKLLPAFIVREFLSVFYPKRVSLHEDTHYRFLKDVDVPESLTLKYYVPIQRLVIRKLWKFWKYAWIGFKHTGSMMIRSWYAALMITNWTHHFAKEFRCRFQHINYLALDSWFLGTYICGWRYIEKLPITETYCQNAASPIANMSKLSCLCLS